MFIIPMAGKSSRFYNAGYKTPKYMLPLGQESCVFVEAIKSFELYFSSDLFLFIIRDEDGIEEFVKSKCSYLGIGNYEIISLNYDTRGQADTVAIGLEKSNHANLNDDIYIFNIDSIRLNFKKPEEKFVNDIGGYLEVFKGEGDHWSFVEPLNNNVVSKTTEKIRISNLCSNGLYYFRSAYLFIKSFTELEKVNNYNELFIAPMYNLLIEEQFIVKYILVDINDTLFSGTPKEYSMLLNQF